MMRFRNPEPWEQVLVSKLAERAPGRRGALGHQRYYMGGEHFILRHGSFYRGQWEGRYPQGPPRQCYGHALLLAVQSPIELRYVEGYALAPSMEVIPHAWCVTAAGQLVDAVWCNTGLAYMGEEFSVERADDASWNGDACILDDCNREFPIFKDPWKGEDWSRQWPASDRLELIRSGDCERQLKWLLANERYLPGVKL